MLPSHDITMTVTAKQQSVAEINAWLYGLGWPGAITPPRSRLKNHCAMANGARECERRRLQIARGLIDPSQLSPEAREDWGTMRLAR